MGKPWNPWGESVDDFDRGVAHCVDRVGRFGIFGLFVGVAIVLGLAAIMDIFFRIDIFKYISGYFFGAAAIGWLVGLIVVLFGVGSIKDPLGGIETKL